MSVKCAHAGTIAPATTRGTHDNYREGTMNITEFLIRRIAEDEAAANRAAQSTDYHMLDSLSARIGPEWTSEDGMVLGGMNNGYPVALWDDEGSGTLRMAPAAAAHIARHDPARVLAECAAKRRIVEECAKEEWVIAQGHLTEWTEGGQAARTTSIHALASVYADHADYQQEWGAR